jgi:hypothetical protein
MNTFLLNNMDALFNDDTFALAKYVKLGATERKARTAEMKILVAVTAAVAGAAADSVVPEKRPRTAGMTLSRKTYEDLRGTLPAAEGKRMYVHPTEPTPVALSEYFM